MFGLMVFAMRRLCCSAGGALVGGVALILLLVPTPVAAATCAAATEIDYEAPLADLPPLPRSSSADGLGIGPPRLRLIAVGDTLNIEKGRFGYELAIQRQTIRRQVALNGYTELKLERVNRRGDVVEPIAARRQALGVVASPAFNGKRFSVGVPARPGLYLFQARLRDGQGQAVGRYADYLRVVRPVTEVRLMVGGGPVRPGGRVDFWVENRGTRAVDPLGAAFAFEVFDGGSWLKAPGSPITFPKIRSKALSAGKAGGCTSFEVPSDARSGRYRFSKDVVFDSGAKRQLTAEFEIANESP